MNANHLDDSCFFFAATFFFGRDLIMIGVAVVARGATTCLGRSSSDKLSELLQQNNTERVWAQQQSISATKILMQEPGKKTTSNREKCEIVDWQLTIMDKSTCAAANNDNPIMLHAWDTRGQQRMALSNTRHAYKCRHWENTGGKPRQGEVPSAHLEEDDEDVVTFALMAKKQEKDTIKSETEPSNNNREKHPQIMYPNPTITQSSSSHTLWSWIYTSSPTSPSHLNTHW